MQQTREGVAARIVGAERMVRAGRLRQRTFQRGQWRGGGGALPPRRAERPIPPPPITRAEAPPPPPLPPTWEKKERARPPSEDRAVPCGEIRAQSPPPRA